MHQMPLPARHPPMRHALLVAVPLAGILLTACASNRIDQRCYVVIEQRLPQAEICAADNKLRYHPYEARELVTAIPPEVAAVLAMEGLLVDLSSHYEDGYAIYDVSTGLDAQEQIGATPNSDLQPLFGDRRGNDLPVTRKIVED